MQKDFRQAIVAVGVIAVVLAGGWGVYYLWHSDLDIFVESYEPPPYTVHCDRDLLASHGVDPDDLPAVQRALRASSDQVQSMDMFIDVNRKDRGSGVDDANAQFYVGVFTKNGCQLQSRVVVAPWDRLDAAMAETLERAVREFVKLARTHKGNLSRAVFMNL